MDAARHGKYGERKPLFQQGSRFSGDLSAVARRDKGFEMARGWDQIPPSDMGKRKDCQRGGRKLLFQSHDRLGIASAGQQQSEAVHSGVVADHQHAFGSDRDSLQAPMERFLTR